MKDKIIETLICPVCHKEFKPNDDTKYRINYDYTCSWKCFQKHYFATHKPKC